MDRNGRFGLAVAALSAATGGFLYMGFLRHPNWPAPLIYAVLFVCAVTCAAALVMALYKPSLEPQARPDAPLQAGFYYYHHRLWPNKTPDDFKTDLEMNFALKQAAFDGRIEVWGAKSTGGAPQKIRPEFWERFGLDPFARGDEPGNRARTEEAQSEGEPSYFFKDLRISKVQFDRAWPRFKA